MDIYKAQRDAAESLVGDELERLGLAPYTDQVATDEVTQGQAVLLAGIQALCISANQELSRQDGGLSDFDKGWFMGQLHIFDMYTTVEKESIHKAREYINKLSSNASASESLTIGEAFKQVGGWMNGGELGYPSFGSMDALRIYTQKALRAALAHPPAQDKLGAAAPDLLVALEGVLRVADRQTDEFDAARAAIAKATGAAP